MDVYFTLQGIEFEWDSDKDYINRQKHGVTLPQASELFFDPFLMPFADEVTSGERRHAVVGITENWQVLYVVYVWRGDAIRLISARQATSHERKEYERGAT
jgi:hypothetical protein